MMRSSSLPVVCALVLWAGTGEAQTPPSQQVPDIDEGRLASIKPRIPEPMVFDLVRPLGAEKGEFELNTLVQLPGEAGSYRVPAWAPEIEYAFAEGHAIEFELPMEGTVRETYKIALQNTFGTFWRQRVIHGFQGIGTFGGREETHSVSLLYLAGVRLNPDWSLFTMHGWHRATVEGTARQAALLNHTLFNKINQRLAFGVESNAVVGGAGNRGVLLIPQVHFELGAKIHLQIGAGAEHRPGNGTHPAMALRLIREL
jgi:hypothetical protein